MRLDLAQDIAGIFSAVECPTAQCSHIGTRLDLNKSTTLDISNGYYRVISSSPWTGININRDIMPVYLWK
jgi:hypothetical protein